MKRLIVSADDYGLCAGTVSGIVHGFRHGIITSAGLMLPVPASMAAVAAARFHPTLDIGVHLTFTAGYPVLAGDWVPSLVNGRGRFLSPQEWLTTGCRPKIGELTAEFRAQISLLYQAGVRVSHLDLHTATGYLMPDVLELTVLMAEEYDLAIRFPFGEGWEQMASSVASQAGIAVEQMQGLVADYRKLIKTKKIPHPDRIVEGFPAGSDHDPDALAALITGLGEGTTEMVTHPAFVAGCRDSLGQGADGRAAELNALCDGRVRRAIEEAGIELINFRGLRAGKT